MRLRALRLSRTFSGREGGAPMAQAQLRATAAAAALLLSVALLATANKVATAEVAAASTALGTPAAPEPHGASEWLAEWLAGLKLSVPPQSFTVADFNVSFDALTCGGAVLGGLTPRRPAREEVALTATGMSLRCEGNWSYVFVPLKRTAQGSGKLRGMLEDSAVDVTLSLSSDRHAGAALPCVAHVAECNARVHATNISLTGASMLEWVLEELQGPLRGVLESVVDGALCTALTEAVSNNLTALIASSDAELSPLLKPVQPQPTPPVKAGAVDWTTNTLIKAAAYFVRGVLDADPHWGINEIARLATNDTGALELPPQAIGGAWVLPGLGTVAFNATSATIGGLDSVKSIDGPVAGAPGVIHASVWLSRLTFDADALIAVAPTNATVHGSVLTERVVVRAALAPVMIGADIFLDVDSAVVRDLTLNEFSDPGCIGEALTGVEILELDANVKVSKLKITPLSGGPLEASLDATIDTVVSMLLDDYGGALTTLVAGAVGGPARAAIAGRLHSAVTNMTAGKTCYRGYDSTLVPKSVTLPIFLSLATACYLLCALLTVSSAVRGTARKCSRWIARGRGEDAHTDARQLDAHEALLELTDGCDDGDAEGRHGSTGAQSRAALMWHPQVARTTAWSMVLMVIGTIFLFLAGILSSGASVELRVEYSGGTGAPQLVRLPPLFQFSSVNSVRDMIHARVYALAAIVAFFSGGWPYCKLLLMLFCWLTPPCYMSALSRERLLMALDALGKWSLIDSFMMCLFMVAFRLHLQTPDESTIPPSSFDAIDVVVVPQAGMFTFMGATVSSLLAGHLMLALHRQAMGVSREDTGKDGSVPEAVVGASNGRSRLCSSVHKRWGALVLVVLITCAAQVAVGVFSETFRFEFEGLSGWLLDPDASRGFSAVSLARDISATSTTPNGIEVRALQAMFLLFVVVVVFAHLVLLSFLWLAKLTELSQRRLFYAAEVLNSWAALDVFVVTVIASVLQIEQFSRFMIGGRCDAIDAIVKEYLDEEVKGVDTCFDVRSVLEPGSWLLVMAAVTWLVVSQVVMRTCENALRRLERQAPSTAGAQEGRGSPIAGFD